MKRIAAIIVFLFPLFSITVAQSGKGVDSLAGQRQFAG